ncbi:MAG: class I SAM-dependent methyltransferase, partial [Acidimicrobiia bacterium]
HRLQPDWRSGSHLQRFGSIRPYVEGRTVLDLGAASGVGRPDWIHQAIERVARETVGIDLDRDLIAKARSLGAEILEADVQTFDLGRTFQTVFAGELIEHIDNQAGFLAAVRRHLDPDGVFVLTTPNAFRVTNFAYRLGNSPVRVNADHVCWFCEQTLTQLLERNGFQIEQLGYVAHATRGWLRGGIMRAVRWLLPERLAWNTLIVVARLGDDDGLGARFARMRATEVLARN